jgi:hypothetical protein
MTLSRSTSTILGATALLLLTACGGGGGGSTTPQGPTTASSLAYTDPTSGTYQLKKNTTLSTPTHLVLDLVATSAGSGTGVAFHLTADTTRVTWAKVQSADAQLVQNGAVFTLGGGVAALKGKASGQVLQAAVSQKGLGSPVTLNGVLARVALDLNAGVTPGSVSLSPVSGKTQALLSGGTTPDITVTVGTLAAQ